MNFPLVGDADRHGATLYGMIHPESSVTATVRTVFVIGRDRKLKLTLTYPAASGRNVDEIIRVLDALQRSSTHPVSTPVNWTDAATSSSRRPFPTRRPTWPATFPAPTDELFPAGYKTLKPYLRLTLQPQA
ncbi:MAG: hypothetical protein M3P34_09725 [Actinomycetota bacterium]|nr:hypothetical protein [Actinomycetota bacterium]